MRDGEEQLQTEKYMKKLLLLYLLCAIAQTSYSQMMYEDPARVGVILLYTSQAKKTLNAYERAQLAMSGAHPYLHEEVKATADFQREFVQYLDSFRNVIQIAAELYGVYNEVTMIQKNITALINVMDEGRNIDNALAVAIWPRRNGIFTQIYKTGMDLAADIHKICFSGVKMTEKERLKIVTRMRPKLRVANNQLRCLTMFIKYTNLIDVWNSIVDQKYKPTSRKEIIERCRLRWKGAWGGR